MPVNNEDITRRAPEQDVVVFSRVRLARNYADTPFSPKMEAEQAGQMIQRCGRSSPRARKRSNTSAC